MKHDENKFYHLLQGVAKAMSRPSLVTMWILDLFQVYLAVRNLSWALESEAKIAAVRRRVKKERVCWFLAVSFCSEKAFFHLRGEEKDFSQGGDYAHREGEEKRGLFRSVAFWGKK